jgi:hypothetical protein
MCNMQGATSAGSAIPSPGASRPGQSPSSRLPRGRPAILGSGSRKTRVEGARHRTTTRLLRPPTESLTWSNTGKWSTTMHKRRLWGFLALLLGLGVIIVATRAAWNTKLCSIYEVNCESVGEQLIAALDMLLRYLILPMWPLAACIVGVAIFLYGVLVVFSPRK